MADSLEPDNEDSFSLSSVRGIPKLTMNNCALFCKEFLHKAVILDEALEWIKTGIKPTFEVPDFDETMQPLGTRMVDNEEADEDELDNDEDAETVAIGQEATVQPAQPAQEPVRRWKNTDAGKFLWQREVNKILAREEKFKNDVNKAWALLLNLMSREVASKVLLNKRFAKAYKARNIRRLWLLMRAESTQKHSELNEGDSYAELISITQTGIFDSYVIKFLDKVSDMMADFDERPREELLKQLFIKGMNKTENKQWLRHYAGTPAYLRPEGLDDMIQHVREYNRTLDSYDVADDTVENKKGAVKDVVTANAGNIGKKGKEKKGNKESVPCWNCEHPRCKKGRFCREASAYCTKCKGKKFHKTEHHDEWMEHQKRKQDQRGNDKKGKSGKNKQDGKQDESKSSDVPGRAHPPQAFQPPFHHNYAANMSLYPSPHTTYNFDNVSGVIDGSNQKAYTFGITIDDGRPTDVITSYTASTLDKRNFEDLVFVLDNGCVGGHLLTTRGAQRILSNLRPAVNAWINSVTGRLKAEFVGNLPLPGDTYYAGIDTANCISLDVWETHGLRYSKQTDHLLVYGKDSNRVILIGKRDSNGHYTCTFKQLCQASERLLHACISTTTTTAHQRYNTLPTNLSAHETRRASEAFHLHRNMGHPSDDYLIRALDHGNITGCNLTSQDVRNMRKLMGPCEACYEGKATLPRDLTSTGMPPTSAPGQLIHCDLIDLPVETVGGNKWSLIAVDDYSGYLSAIMMKNKSRTSVQEAMRDIISFFNRHQHRVLAFMTDPERVLLSTKDFLASVGIKLHDTVPGLHERKSERFIRTLRERERTLKASLMYELPQQLSGELRITAADLLNSMPNANTGPRTPTEIVTGVKPVMIDYPFGQPGLFYHTTTKDGKTQSNGDYGIVIGYNRDARNRYRVYFPFINSVLSRGSFQSLEYIPKEWGWPARLRPRQPRAPATAASIPPLPAPNQHIQSGNPIVGNENVNNATVPPPAEQLRIANIPNHIPFANIPHAPPPEGTPTPPPPPPPAAPAPEGTPQEPPAVAEEGITPTPAPVASALPIAPAQEGTSVQQMEHQQQHVQQAHEETVSHVDPPPATPSTSTPVRAEPPPKPPPARHHPPDPESPYVTRTGRTVKPAQRYLNASVYEDKTEQISYKISVKQALESEYRNESMEAIRGEIDYMITYKCVQPVMYHSISASLRHRIVPTHMFLKHKFLPDGQFDRIKARLVAGGNLQAADLFTETNSPTINPITVMTMLNIMTVENMECSVYDLKGAFLSTPVLPDDPDQFILIPKDLAAIWIHLYPQYRQYQHTNGCLYMKLLKYIYGLKEAARKFHEHLKRLLVSDGFQQSIADECMFTKHVDSYLLVVGVHVDDLLVISHSKSALQNFEQFLKTNWDLNKQDENQFAYVGLSVKRDRINKETLVSQEKFLNDIVNKYRHQLPHSRSTPMDISYPTMDISHDEKCGKHEFLSLLMSLMYLARYTRTDILFSTVFLATRCEQPTKSDMKAALKIVSYLATTGNYAFMLSGDHIDVKVYVDASFGIHYDGKGHSAIIITLGSAPIATRSVKQKIGALHSTDAEIIAVTEALTYVLWLRVLFAELQYVFHSPIPVFQDNQSAMLIYNGGGKFRRSKHMLVKQNYIKDLISHKIVQFSYLSTENMLADLATKPVSSPTLQRMMKELRIIKV